MQQLLFYEIVGEKVEKLKQSKKEAWESLVREYVHGDVRADGKVFWGYSKSRSVESNFEVWLSREAFEDGRESIRRNDERRRERYAEKVRVLKRGDVREDGKVFYEYCQRYASTDFELWLDREDFELRCFNDGQKNSMKRSMKRFGGKDELRSDIFGLNDYDLRMYIESLFEDGMSWSNWGSYEGKWDPENPKWHIDHILPLSAVDNLEDTKHLWHYTNLRPMWGNENLGKRAKHCPEKLEAFLEERRASK